MEPTSLPVAHPARSLLLPALIVAGVVLGHAVFTGQIWEDYWITFRASRNLVDGFGLVFQPGEKVHTYTSPLGVLLPALCYWLTGSDGGAMWAFRLLSAAASGGAAWLLVLHGREFSWPRAAVATGFGLVALDAKNVAFAANGMETGLLLLFTALAWREFWRPAGFRAGPLAAAFAGLMWTRPDAFLVAGALLVGWWVFRDKPVAGGAPSTRLLRPVLLGIALYLPWLLWAWWYYGNPVPHTIIAKSAYTNTAFSPVAVLFSPLRLLVENSSLDGLFAPPYAVLGGWPSEALNAARLLARVAAFAWLVPALSPTTRAASLATFLGALYLDRIMPYPWYYAPWTFCGAVTLAGLVQALVAGSPRRVRLGQATAACALLFAAGLLLAWAVTARHQQRLTEELGRRPIGLWLKENARPGDTVFLEPLGYIGYYSNLKMLDFPGLSAPEVSSLVRSGRRSFAQLIRTLEPDWLVLRGHEAMDPALQKDGALDAYEVILLSDRRKEISQVTFLPGRGLLDYDSVFLVYRRRPPSSP